MNTEKNIIDNTFVCDESKGYISKENTCCNDTDVLEDRPKSWYILPILFDNINVCNRNNIINVNYIDIVGMSLITIKYNKNCINDIKNIIKENEDLFYNDNNLHDGYEVTFKIPEDKKYLCDIISKRGSLAINKMLFNKYFLKLL